MVQVVRIWYSACLRLLAYETKRQIDTKLEIWKETLESKGLKWGRAELNIGHANLVIIGRYRGEVKNKDLEIPKSEQFR